MGTPATQILERPAFGTRTRSIGRSGSDLEPGCATRSLQPEADRAQVLGDDRWRPASVQMLTSLALPDAGAWRSGCAGVEVDLIDAVLGAERSAAAYLDVRASGMTAGGSLDEMDAVQAELGGAQRRRLEQTKRGLAKRRISA